jgi:hypothetical protein
MLTKILGIPIWNEGVPQPQIPNYINSIILSAYTAIALFSCPNFGVAKLAKTTVAAM